MVSRFFVVALLFAGCVARDGYTNLSTVAGDSGVAGDPGAAGGDSHAGDSATGDPGVIGVTFVVTSTEDTHDDDPGDGACADAALECTLRAALEEANASPGVDTVEVPTGQIWLTEGELPVTDGAQVHGVHAGLTTLRCPNSRAFRVTSASFTLNHVTIEECRVAGDGAAILASDARLSVTSSAFLYNAATAGSGGAIFLAGPGSRLDVNASRFTTNSASLSGGAIDVEADHILIERTLFATNRAQQFGSVRVDAPAVSVLANTFSRGDALAGSAGALGLAGGGQPLVANNTFFANSANGNGGALLVTDGTLRLHHNTFAQSVTNGEGGGVAVEGVASVELANNVFQWGYAAAGDINCHLSGTGSLTSLGGNVSDRPAADCSLTVTDTADTTDEHLSPSLELRGGPTPTLAPVLGSPAIDAGVSAQCLPTDQRGLPRAASSCDAGAFEVQGGEPPCCLSYLRSWLRVPLGRPISTVSPKVRGDDLTYSVSPPLPDGLVLDPNTGFISGTATAGEYWAVHTISATNAFGATTTELDIQVWPAFVVSSSAETPDLNPGDGVCDAGGGCTLRAALEENNQVFPHVIVLPASTYPVSQSLQSNRLVAIVGAGIGATFLDGTGVRVIAAADDRLYLSDLTIQNGLAATGMGGGVRAADGLWVSNVQFTNNSAETGGGAIAALAQVCGRVQSHRGKQLHRDRLYGRRRLLRCER